MITLIAAVSSDGVIGKLGHIPWRLQSDMDHFKKLTTGHTVVMGRKTWDSIPSKFRPLPNRRNLVMSRQNGFVAEGAKVIHSMEDALKLTEETEHVFFIGGENVYRGALPFAERLLITRVHMIVGEDSDALFPNLVPEEWNLVWSEDGVRGEKDDHEFTFQVYYPNLRFIELAAVRGFEQLKIMRQIRKAGHCPFCPENLPLYHKNPILREKDYWIVIDNQWPYPGKNIHQLVILKQHAERFWELSREAWDELGLIARGFGLSIAGGGMGFRFGDPILSGASVKHLHFQLISPIKGCSTQFFIGIDGKRAISQ